MAKRKALPTPSKTKSKKAPLKKTAKKTVKKPAPKKSSSKKTPIPVAEPALDVIAKPISPTAYVVHEEEVMIHTPQRQLRRLQTWAAVIITALIIVTIWAVFLPYTVLKPLEIATQATIKNAQTDPELNSIASDLETIQQSANQLEQRIENFEPTNSASTNTNQVSGAALDDLFSDL